MEVLRRDWESAAEGRPVVEAAIGRAEDLEAGVVLHSGPDLALLVTGFVCLRVFAVGLLPDSRLDVKGRDAGSGFGFRVLSSTIFPIEVLLDH
jgi:hypothetical protein